MRKLFKAFLAILAITLVCTTGFTQTTWPPFRATTTIGPQDYWYFYTPVAINELYIGGNTGTNGTIYVNWVPLPTVDTMVIDSQMGAGAWWDTNLNQWIFIPTNAKTVTFDLVVGLDTIRWVYVNGLLTSLQTNGVEYTNSP